MKKIYFFCLFNLILIFSSCELPVDPLEDYENYLPLAVGNYWVYEHDIYEKGNSTKIIATVIDSFVVVRDSIIDGSPAFILNHWEDGKSRYNHILKVSLNSIENFYNAFNCEPGCPSYFIPLISQNTHLEDSLGVEGRPYPSRIVDSSGVEKIILNQIYYASKFNHHYKVQDELLIADMNNKDYMHMIGPEPGKFRRDSNRDDIIYLNDDRTILINDSKSTLKFKSGVGLYSSESYNNITKKQKQTRRLLRYEVK